MEVQPVSERRLWLVWSVGKGKTVDRRGVEKKTEADGKSEEGAKRSKSCRKEKRRHREKRNA